MTPVTTDPVTGHYQLDFLFDYGTFALNPSSAWELADVRNPMRDEARGTGWPYNAWDEAPPPAMAKWFADNHPNIITAHVCAGQDGQPYSGIKKGGSAASYAGSVDEVARLYTLLTGLGKIVKVAGVALVHGESDNGNASYSDYIQELQGDYDADLKAITGQTEDIPVFTTQPSAGYPTALGSTSNIHEEMLEAAAANPLIKMVGPKYAVEYASGDFHLTPTGTRDMARLYASKIYQHIIGNSVDSLYPLSVTKTSSTTIKAVMSQSGLSFDTSAWDSNHSVQNTEWASGKGFEVTDNTGKLSISGVSIAGDEVTVTVSSTIGTSPRLAYAHNVDGDNKPRRGQLRVTGGDWCCHFDRAAV